MHQLDLPLKRRDVSQMVRGFGADALRRMFQLFGGSLSAGDLNQQRHVVVCMRRAARAATEEISDKRHRGQRGGVDEDSLEKLYAGVHATIAREEISRQRPLVLGARAEAPHAEKPRGGRYA